MEETNKNKEIQVKCRFCGSQNYSKQGFRKTEKRGRIQKYKCSDCNKYFTNDEGFYRMRNHEKKISKAIDLYFSNLSSRKVRNNYRRHEETKVSHVTVLDWCRRYTLKVQKFVNRFKPKLSGECYADETEIDRGKNHNDIFWCSIDWETRFINATHYSPFSQSKVDATKFMENIKRNGTPEFIQTDYASWYIQPVKKVLGEKVLHWRNNVSQTKRHNVRIETVFMKIKDRVTDFRGLKALWSAPILLAGIVLQHNFIEEHTTIRDLPCDRAGLNFDCGVNRWLGLIKMASNVA